MSPGRTGRRRFAVDLRREVPILVPTAVLLLVVLSTFILVSYRNAIFSLIDQRRGEAERLARNLTSQLGSGALPTSYQLLGLAPQALRVAVVDATGRSLVFSGDVEMLVQVVPKPGEVISLGPDDQVPGVVVALAPLLDEARFVRVDLAAPILDGQRRGLRLLTILVLGLNAVLSAYILLLLRQLLVPYERLLERAQQVGPEHPGGPLRGDQEVGFLLDTFERALRALADTERTGAEDDLAVLERTLLASIESGLLLLDRTGCVLALNPVAAELLDIPRPHAGTPLEEALAARPPLIALLRDAVDRQLEVQRRECSLEFGGRRHTLGLTVHPLRRDDGHVRGFLVLFADLTEVQRQAAEQRLAESLSRLGELAGGIAHELRNSLATLRGYLTLIERRPDEESIADYLSEIRHETDHLQRVVEDFLSFARPGSVRLAEVELETLVRRAAADPSLGGMAVEIRGSGEAPVRLKGDPQLLERALRNLLHNAAQAEREAGSEGPLEVTLGGTPESPELTIGDRGPGLPPQVRIRLFEPFATGRSGGVGLGLALARRILDLHGASLELEDRPGGGTCARMRFAAAGDEPAHSVTESSIADPSGS